MVALSSAHVAAFNTTLGHELLHRKHIIHKICGTLSFSKMLYSHYFVQHVTSHHKMVATTEDSSTGLLGESVFAFHLRAIPQGISEVWEIEPKRLVKNGKSPYSIENKLIWYNILHALYLGAIY